MEHQALFDQPNKVVRKRKMLNISEKVELITLIKNFPKRKKKDIAAQFGIPINTVSAIYANREKILERCKGDFTNMNLKRLRPSTYPDIEKGLLDWYIENHTNGYISCLALRTKALEVAKALGYDNFTASNGWIERFKSRHNLKSKRYKDKNLTEEVVVSCNDPKVNTSGNDISQSTNFNEMENLSRLESYHNQVWENISNPVMELTEFKQEYDDNYSFNSETHSSSNQNENDKVQESSPSPSHLIPEVHLTETASDSDNHICLQNNSHNNLAYEMDQSMDSVPIQFVENAFNVIVNYVENCDENVSEKTYGALKDLKTFISCEKKRKSQSKITDYFRLQ